MSEFMFSDLIVNLNLGVILKDSNSYTIFSKNTELVIKFFANFFSSECTNLDNDLKSLFTGMVNNVTHPQLVVSLLKVLSTDFSEKNQV